MYQRDDPRRDGERQPQHNSYQTNDVRKYEIQTRRVYYQTDERETRKTGKLRKSKSKASIVHDKAAPIICGEHDGDKSAMGKDEK